MQDQQNESYFFLRSPLRYISVGLLLRYYVLDVPNYIVYCMCCILLEPYEVILAQFLIYRPIYF